MKLTDYLSLPLIRVPLAATEKTQAITELVDLLAAEGLTRDRNRLLAAVLERESQRTTGIGRGFAIPHAKSDAVERMSIAFGRPPNPIDFAAIDGRPVSLIVLLASPPNATGTHIQALAKISRLAISEATLHALLSAQSREDFYQVISRCEGP